MDAWGGRYAAKYSQMSGRFFLRQSKEQNELLLALQETTSREEFERIKEMIAHTMGSIYINVLYWIFKEYPEIRPKGMPESV